MPHLKLRVFSPCVCVCHLQAVQQFGRVHRSNQLHLPEFHVIVTEMGGEIRFTSTVARRMKMLGQGDSHKWMDGWMDPHTHKCLCLCVCVCVYMGHTYIRCVDAGRSSVCLWGGAGCHAG